MWIFFVLPILTVFKWPRKNDFLLIVWNSPRDRQVRESNVSFITGKADQRVWLTGATTVNPLTPSNTPELDTCQTLR